MDSFDERDVTRGFTGDSPVEPHLDGFGAFTYLPAGALSHDGAVESLLFAGINLS